MDHWHGFEPELFDNSCPSNPADETTRRGTALGGPSLDLVEHFTYQRVQEPVAPTSHEDVAHRGFRESYHLADREPHDQLVADADEQLGEVCKQKLAQALGVHERVVFAGPGRVGLQRRPHP